jgi:uncharacterized phage-associated protein
MKHNHVLNIARYFIQLGEKAGRKITNKKLQKLLYYAQAWSLVLDGKLMFKEDLEAWIHGPVVPKVYHHYKKFGFGPISDDSKIESTAVAPHQKILDEVWKVYGRYDSDYLELLTHSEDPWMFARNELDANKASQAVISTDLMLSFYSSMLQRLSKNAKKN